MTNHSITHKKKGKKEEEEAKAILNILKYTLIKNLKQLILILKWRIILETYP